MSREVLLERAAQLLLGQQWQRALATALGPHHPEVPRDAIDERLVRRWAGGQRPIPGWVFGALAKLARERAGTLGGLVHDLEEETRRRANKSAPKRVIRK